jgi:thymidine phosphorylase
VQGSFIYVVGPSGAGKDSLISAARERLSPESFVFARRTITRRAGSPGEDHDSCTPEEFARREAAGDFLITWNAHSLHYGLSSSLLDDLAAGRNVIANGSRNMIAALAERVPSLLVVEVTAPAHILQERLHGRGRETPDDVAKRLQREVKPYPEGVQVVQVVNDQSLEVGITRFLDTLVDHLGLAPVEKRALLHKIAGKKLTEPEYRHVLGAIADQTVTGAELDAFLIACTESLDDDELIAVARCRCERMPRIDWGRQVVVDKHSMGGIPGSRVTMVVIPIIAAHGLLIPKTSSRAITSAAGTADAMEVLARVDLTPAELRRVVLETNACIAWNGKLNHSALDDAMNAITRPLGLDTRRWSVASILSKKYSAGATHVVIDIPYSPTGKVKSRTDGEELARLFEMVGARLGLVVRAFATQGDAPIGRGIGPALETRDVLMVLDNHPDAPQDLLDKSLFFAGQILALAGAVDSPEAGRTRAQALLASGAARKALDRIVNAQGAQPPADISGLLTQEIVSSQGGVVQGIDGYVISGVARAAGAPRDAWAGVDLVKTIGTRVVTGDTLYRIQSRDARSLADAVALARASAGFTLAG